MDATDLIKQYLSTGQPIPERQFNQLNKNQLSTYFYHRLIAAEQHRRYGMTKYEITHELGKKALIDSALAIPESDRKYAVIYDYESPTDMQAKSCEIIIINNDNTIYTRLEAPIVQPFYNIDVYGVKNNTEVLYIHLDYANKYLVDLKTKKWSPSEVSRITDYAEAYDVFIGKNYDKQYQAFIVDHNGKIIKGPYSNLMYGPHNGIILAVNKDRYNILDKNLKEIFKVWPKSIYQTEEMKQNEKTKFLYYISFVSNNNAPAYNIFDVKTLKLMFKNNKPSITVTGNRITWQEELILEHNTKHPMITITI